MFVSQREFRLAVTLCEREGTDPRRFFGPRRLFVHQDSIRWYLWESAYGRMVTHFGMLSD